MSEPGPQTRLIAAQVVRAAARKRLADAIGDCLEEVALHGAAAVPRCRVRLAGDVALYDAAARDADSALIDRVAAMLAAAELERERAMQRIERRLAALEGQTEGGT